MEWRNFSLDNCEIYRGIIHSLVSGCWSKIFEEIFKEFLWLYMDRRMLLQFREIFRILLYDLGISQHVLKKGFKEFGVESKQKLMEDWSVLIDYSIGDESILLQ